MDKHKLYRAIKQARGQQEQQLCAGLGQYELSGNSGGDLLDLDAHDGDLIEVGSSQTMTFMSVRTQLLCSVTEQQTADQGAVK